MKSMKKAPHYTLLTVIAAMLVYPLFFTFATSLMTNEEAHRFPAPLVPESFHIQNFIDVMDFVPIVAFIQNSFIVSGFIMFGQLITASMAAYAFSHLQFPGRNTLFAVFVSTMMIPWEVTIIPNYLTIKAWGWLDTYQGLTIPFVATAFGTFLLRQFFLQLPRELFEAAKIDGCGHLRIFTWLVLPLARPALATLGVYSFLHAWNMYLWPLLVTNSETMRTVQIGVTMLQREEFTAWNIVLAGVTLVLLPSLLLLGFGIKQLVQGITAGALKG
nr:carbohydrate ABC transporter permease [Paenibacillus turpanensis]